MSNPSSSPLGQPQRPAGPRQGGNIAASRRREPTVDLARPERKDLDRDQISRLLDQLGRRLESRGVSASLYVVGGAALAMGPMGGRRTVDVDVAHLDDVVAAEAEQLAVEEGLPLHWLNSSAAPWVPSTSPVSRGGEAAGLTVVYAKPEQLLAMKIVAHRRRDAEDISALASVLGMTGAPASTFENLLRSVYGGEGELAQVIGGPDDGIDDEVRHLAETASRLAKTAPPGTEGGSYGSFLAT